MRSFYTLSETGSGGEVWKFRFVTHGYRVFYKKIMAGRTFFDIITFIDTHTPMYNTMQKSTILTVAKFIQP